MWTPSRSQTSREDNSFSGKEAYFLCFLQRTRLAPFVRATVGVHSGEYCPVGVRSPQGWIDGFFESDSRKLIQQTCPSTCFIAVIVDSFEMNRRRT